MKALCFFLVTTFLVTLAWCGREHQVVTNEKYDNLTLVLFSAPWCHSCSEELKEIDKRDWELHEKISIATYTITGTTAGQPPSLESAEEYRKELKVSLDIFPDYNRKIYSQHFGKIELPAAILLTLIEKCDGTTCTVEEKKVYVFKTSASVNEIIHTSNDLISS